MTDTRLEGKTEQEFLDSNQYTDNGIKRYEYIFGDGFISSGGKITTENIISRLSLKSDDIIIDVGCGIGGSANYISNKFNCHITAVDLSSNVIRYGKQKYSHNKKIEFIQQDILKMTLEDNSIDLIYSRDVLLHFTPEKKIEFFNFCFQKLRHGGKICITDYCCGPPEILTKEFSDYIKQRQYCLVPYEEYIGIIKSSGLFDIQSENVTPLWIETLEREREHLINNKEEFLSYFKQSDFDDLLNGWTNKIDWAKQSILQWGLFIFQKP